MIRKSSKFLLLALMWGIYLFLYNLYYPVSITPVAKKLLEDSADSVTSVHAYQQLFQYSYIPLLIISVYILRKNIKSLLFQIKMKRKEDKNE